MMPARDAERPQEQEFLKMKPKIASVNDRLTEIPLFSKQGSSPAGKLSWGQIPTLEKSQVHGGQKSNNHETGDTPNANFSIVYESMSMVGLSCDQSNRIEAVKASDGSVSNKVQSDVTKVLSPFASPMGYPQTAKLKLAAMKQLQMKSQAKHCEIDHQAKSTDVSDPFKLPEHEALSENNLKKLLAAKKTLSKTSSGNFLVKQQLLVPSKQLPVPKSDQIRGDPETPKFIESPKAISKPLNLLASLKQLKSTLPKRNFLN
jgi:hypothetical protein